jgi:hypothetical protein
LYPSDKTSGLLSTAPTEQARLDKQLTTILSDWPMERRADRVRLVNEPMTEKEAQRVRTCIARNRPFGSGDWQDEQARRLGLLHTLRSEGRPKATEGERRVEN